MHRSILILCISLLFVCFYNCAPRGAYRPKTRYSNKHIQKESHSRMLEVEKKNRDILKRRFIYKIKFYLGTPYKFGGDNRRGMDCSGFVSTIYRECFKLKIPHNTLQIYQQCLKIQKKKLVLGDLVFFKTNLTNINHIGIYLQDDYFVHSSSSYGVVVSSFNEKYYQKRFAGGGRILNKDKLNN